MTKRKPETQKTWDDEFDATEKSAKWCRDETEKRLIIFRQGAVEYAKCLLIKHGYFNGDIECTVTHKENVIGVKVVLSCYGLPSTLADAEDEISRLRDVLKKIDDDPPIGLDWNWHRDIAREALP